MPKSYAVAALAAAFLAAPVLARHPAPSPVAAPGGPVTLATWSERVERELDKRMQYPRDILYHQTHSGVVRVKFNCSDSGRPAKVALYKSSGDRALDRAAVEAVQRVSTLHPLPDGMGHQQRYVATLLFAADYDDYTAQIASLRAAAKKSNAWFKGPAAIALLDDQPGAGG